MYKTLLRLVSGATHEVVTRKKLSQQSRDAASNLSRGLRALLSDGDDLRPVKRCLDDAASTLSRSSPDLEDARGMLDAALSRERSSKKTGAKKRAAKPAPGERSAGKKTAGKKRAVSRQATGKTRASKTPASKKQASGKASATVAPTGARKTGSKKRQAKRSGAA